MTAPQLWFAFFNGFSGQILFDRWSIALFNILFALLPPLAIGIFEQHLSAETLLAVSLAMTHCARGHTVAQNICKRP